MATVLCIAGMPGCGKEEFVKVAQERGLAIVRMGDVVREEAKRRGLKFSDETVGGMAHEERIRHVNASAKAPGIPSEARHSPAGVRP